MPAQKAIKKGKTGRGVRIQSLSSNVIFFPAKFWIDPLLAIAPGDGAPRPRPRGAPANIGITGGNLQQLTKSVKFFKIYYKWEQG